MKSAWNRSEEYILPGIVFGSVCRQIISAHYQQSRQNMDKHTPDPRRHYVSLWWTEVDIEDYHGYAYTAMKRNTAYMQRFP